MDSLPFTYSLPLLLFELLFFYLIVVRKNTFEKQYFESVSSVQSVKQSQQTSKDKKTPNPINFHKRTLQKL